MRCRRESAVAQCGNVSEKAGATTRKRVPIALRRGENRLPAGLLIQPKEGTRKKPAAFARKLRTNSQKRPTFARELRDFVPRLCAGQRNSESTVRQRAGERPRMRAALRGLRGTTSHCAAPPSRNETMDCRRATGSTTKRPSPLESRKGRSGAALNGRQLTLRQRDSGRDQDLRSNSWRFSRRLVSRNS